MKKLAYLLIVIGIITMFFPKIKSMYYSHQEQQLLKDWEANTVAKQSYQELDDIFQDKHKPQKTVNPTSKKNNILGKLEIKKINLTIPIMEGASLKNLKVAAGHLKGTSPIGEIGNAAIAAHRSYTYGKQFNRLTELDTGDTIKIITKQKKLTYRISKKMIVKPNDLSVLKNDQSKSILTLITCQPMKNPTHRFIVKAVLQKEEVL